MLTSIDKAWVAGLVSFIGMTSMQFFGFEIPETVQAGIISAIMFVLTYLTPNKET